MGNFDYYNKAILNLPMRIGEHDATNTRTLDVSPSQIHATYTAGATAPTKISGQRGYTFDGGDYFELGDNYDIRTNNFSYCVSFKNTQDAIGAIRGLVQKSVSAASVGRWGMYLAGADGTLTCILQTTASGTQTITGVLTRPGVGSLHSGIVSMARTGNMTLYLDTQVVGSLSIAPSAAEDLNTANICRIGCYNDAAGAPANYLTGMIYCVSFYPIALTQIQVNDWHQDMMRRCNDT